MLNYFLGNCNCYSSNTPDISADIEIFNLDIIEAFSNEEISISLDLKFSLNCTTVTKGDVLYLSKYLHEIKKEIKFKGSDLKEENMLYLEDDAESSYSGLVQNTFKLSPDMYCVFYLRPQLRYDPMNSNWKILGISKTFKLDLLEEDSSLLKKSSISINNSKSNTSFMDFFNKLGFSDSPPKHDLQISKLQQINLDDEKEPEFTKKRTTNHQIFSIEDREKTLDFDKSFRNILNETGNLINETGFLTEKPKEKLNKLSEVNDAQKFYAESLMKIKKSNQDFILSPKNRFTAPVLSGKLKKKAGHKENYEE